MGKGENKPVLATRWQYGFLLSFSRLEHEKIGQSGGDGTYRGGGNRLPTSYAPLSRQPLSRQCCADIERTLSLRIPYSMSVRIRYELPHKTYEKPHKREIVSGACFQEEPTSGFF